MDRDGVAKHTCFDPYCGCKPQRSKFRTAPGNPWEAFFGNRDPPPPPPTYYGDPYATLWNVEVTIPYGASMEDLAREWAVFSKPQEPVHETNAQ
jgi:hypothetical protein